MRNLTCSLLALLLLTAACARAPQPAPEPAAPPAQPAPPPLAEQFLPPEGVQLTYRLSDGPDMAERFVRHMTSLVGEANGQTYLTWFITNTGVWRQDPRGGEGQPLLRYLPPILEDGLAWSHGPAVHFRLLRLGPCGEEGVWQSDECWELTALNREELTLFTLARGYGPVLIRSENLRSPSASWTKQLVKAEPATADEATRRRLIDEAASWGPQAVVQANRTDFAELIAAQRERFGNRPVTTVDLNGDGRLDQIEGALGEWTKELVALLSSEGKRWHEFTLAGSMRVQLVRLNGLDRPAILVEHSHQPDPRGHYAYLHAISDKGGLLYTGGWIMKGFGTLGHTFTVDQEGLLTVTWDVREGHTIDRRYRIVPGNGGLRANLEAQMIRPTAGEWRLPEAEVQVLTAAFVAHWYGLTAEYGRYFAGPPHNLAQDVRDVPVPVYPSLAELGAPGADGGTPFTIVASQYEASHTIRGTVWFERDGAGQIRIRKLEIQEITYSHV